MALPSETCLPSLALPLEHRPSISAARCWNILDANMRKICVVGPGEDAERRAAEMVQACNAMPALIAEMRQALRQWKMYAEITDERDIATEKSPEASMYRIAQAALAQAEASHG